MPYTRNEHNSRRRRDDWQHKLTHNLAKNHSLIVIEDLKLANMTRSARGTIESPGKNVRQKAGLNRSLQEVAPGVIIRQLTYKCAWYGSTLIRVNPGYTSQTCYECGHVCPDNRAAQAHFKCVWCNHENNADVNAAKNILRRGLNAPDSGLCRLPVEAQ